MNKTVPTLVVAFLGASFSACQVAGGSAYAQGRPTGRGAAEEYERARRNEVTNFQDATSNTVEVSVLFNRKADEYVAVFGVSEEGSTIDQSRTKTDATVHAFVDKLRQLGVQPKDISVDFIVQNKIYGYDADKDVAREKIVGYEVKKNVAIHFTDKARIDEFLDTASSVGIFDLIKVDYVVKNILGVHAQMMEVAAQIVRAKTSDYARLFGVKLKQAKQVCAATYGTYYPTDMYDSYTASEGQDVDGGYFRQRYAIIGTRKSRTFYFNALTAKDFDCVLNPVVTEPVVQFTLYLKLRYDIGSKDAETKTASKVVHKRVKVRS